MSRDLIGRQLGHFRVVEKIGEGGMGVVYVAKDDRLRRTVAFKVLRPEMMNDERRRGRFLREARFAAALAHPNVCAVHEVGESDGLVYMAMELLEGTSLRVRLGRGRLPVTQALTIARDIARALARAHEKGIVHRDLKPDNVIVYEPNPGVLAAKVLDFGLAKALVSDEEEARGIEHENTATFVTAQGVAIGTPGYMAPEQARGLPVDERADVYSFGVMLYEMLTGRSPYRATTPEELIAAPGREEMRPPSELVKGIPPALDALYMHCVERTIGRRLPDGAALVTALEPLCDPTSRPSNSGAGVSFDDETERNDDRPRPGVPAAPTMSVANLPTDSISLVSAEPVDSVSVVTEKRPPVMAPSAISGSTPPAPPLPTNEPLPEERPAGGLRLVHFAGFGAIALVAFFLARHAWVSDETHVLPPVVGVATPSAPPSAAPPPPSDEITSDPPIASSPPKNFQKPTPRHRTTKPAAPQPTPSPSPAASAEDCSNPFTVVDGIRVPKRQCLRPDQH